MRAVVTGGAGFIGSHVVDALLERGDEVVVVDDLSSGRREWIPAAAKLVVHDIRRPYEVEADTIFHLAAQADVGTSMAKPGFDAEVNVVGTVNTLEAARACGAEVVFSSTGGAIYGDVDAPAAEETPRRPVSAYGIAKLAPRSTSPAGTASTARATPSCASRTSTGRASRPRSRAGSSRSSWSGSGAARRRSSSATASRRATTSTSATSSRQPSRRPGTGGLQRRDRRRDDGERAPSTLRASRRRRSRARTSRAACGRRAPERPRRVARAA